MGGTVMEIWKPIKNYEQYYMVSNTGRIMSLIKRSGSHGKIIEAKRKKILKPCNNGNGYLYVTLTNRENKQKHYYVHRIVAETFLDNHNNYKYINHLDYNTQNNNAENLQWCTQKENVLYSSEKMRHQKSKSKPTKTGEKYITIKLSKNGHVYYRLQIKRLGIDKKFSSIADAIIARGEAIK